MTDLTGEEQHHDYVPCEACDLSVPSRLATLLPLDGCYVCNACIREMPALSGRNDPLAREAT